MRWYFSHGTRVGLALGLLSLASLGLFAAGALANHSSAFSYLIWNLFLAWVPLGLSLWLNKVLQRKLWSSWEGLLASVLWIGFLPNSFYMVTDFIHIQEAPRVDLLYDVVMFSSFIFTGLLLGFISLYIIHHALLQRLSRRLAHLVVAGILFVCSFAIYLGRDLRWNTWDILVNPGGILIDVSERFLHPLTYSPAYTTTIIFFVLLSTVYIVGWQLARAMRYQKRMDDLDRS